MSPRRRTTRTPEAALALFDEVIGDAMRRLESALLEGDDDVDRIDQILGDERERLATSRVEFRAMVEKLFAEHRASGRP